jgi:diguanylate cyclase (GGDEF)-like protein
MSDTAARFGGDEFAIVLPAGQVRDAEALAGRVRQAVAGMPVLVTEGVLATITLSIGVAIAAPAAGSRDLKPLAERLIVEADGALYKSKEAGRNCVTVANTLVT